jgi:hypothetical protein
MCSTLTSLHILFPLWMCCDEHNGGKVNIIVYHIRDWFHGAVLPSLFKLALDLCAFTSGSAIHLVPKYLLAETSTRGPIIPEALARQLNSLVISFGKEDPREMEVKEINHFCTLFGVASPSRALNVVIGEGINVRAL